MALFLLLYIYQYKFKIHFNICILWELLYEKEITPKPKPSFGF
jgi:hypothetical protein